MAKKKAKWRPVFWGGKHVRVDESKALHFYYRNHAGVESWRRAVPLPAPIMLAAPDAKHHPGDYVMLMWDLDRDGERAFALSGMRGTGPDGAVFHGEGPMFQNKGE